MSYAGKMLRPARLSDAPEIARIHVDAWQGVHAASAGFPASPPFDQRLAHWHHVLGGGPRRIQVRVALDELGKIRGFTAAGAARVLKVRYDGEVNAVYVDPSAQRQGIGSALAKDALARLRAEGFASIMVWIPEPGNARFFFEALGASDTGERRLTALGSDRLPELGYAWPPSGSP